MKNKTNHTHLYVSLVLLAIFAVVFFLFRQKIPNTPSGNGSDNVPFNLSKMNLTPEEIEASNKQYENPALTQKMTLTQAEIQVSSQQKKNPQLTAKQN